MIFCCKTAIYFEKFRYYEEIAESIVSVDVPGSVKNASKSETLYLIYGDIL